MPLESAVGELIGSFRGMSVAELATETDEPDVDLTDKSAHARLVRRLLEERGLYAGLVDRGATVKVVRRDPKGDPIEKMTFPNFDHEAFPRETWETSRLRKETREILLVIFDAVRGQLVENAELAGAFFWSPSPEQDRRMERGWRRSQEAIKYHYEPPKEKDTDAVHVATKGRDSYDIEEGAQGTYRKECLAFNKSFVSEIVAAGMAGLAGS